MARHIHRQNNSIHHKLFITSIEVQRCFFFLVFRTALKTKIDGKYLPVTKAEESWLESPPITSQRLQSCSESGKASFPKPAQSGSRGDTNRNAAQSPNLNPCSTQSGRKSERPQKMVLSHIGTASESGWLQVGVASFHANPRKSLRTTMVWWWQDCQRTLLAKLSRSKLKQQAANATVGHIWDHQ